MYSCFLFVIQPRVFFHFAWIFGAGERIYFLCSLGEGAYSYRAALFARSPVALHRGGTPTPLPGPLGPDSHL